MKYCECEEPKHGDRWVTVGVPGNRVDLQLCDDCNQPIQGTAATHVDGDEA